jgi:hypothetical protein
METIPEGYCLKLKLKVKPADGNDAWLVCMSSSDLAGAWAKSFSGVII